MIRDHVYRRFHGGNGPKAFDPAACAYMSCRRPRADHEREFRPRVPDADR